MPLRHCSVTHVFMTTGGETTTTTTESYTYDVYGGQSYGVPWKGWKGYGMPFPWLPFPFWSGYGHGYGQPGGYGQQGGYGQLGGYGQQGGHEGVYSGEEPPTEENYPPPYGPKQPPKWASIEWCCFEFDNNTVKTNNTITTVTTIITTFDDLG